MKIFLSKVLISAAILIGISVNSTFAATLTDKIIVCGHNSVAVIDSSSGKPVTVWSYKNPKEVGYTSCELYHDNTKLLLSSAFSGVDIMDVASKTVISHWDIPCAHHAVWLSHDLILAAGSTCSYNKRHYNGYIYLLNGATRGGEPLNALKWSGAHYLLPNNDGKDTFWVTSHPYLSLGSVVNDGTSSPFIKIDRKYKAPAYDNKTTQHALTMGPDGRYLLFATQNDVYRFDLTTKTITKYFPTPVRGVKSIDFNKNTGLMMYVSNASRHSNTTQTISFGDGSTLTLPKSHIYRAFWVYGNLPASSGE